MTTHLDPLAVRLLYLSLGGNPQATAERLGVSRQSVHAALKRANRDAPFTYPGERGTPEREAMTAFVRAQLDRVGIRH